MLAPAERARLIDQIAHLPAQVAALVRGLSAEQLVAAAIPGEWTVAQNVHHLCDSHMNSYIRCKLIASEHNPPLKPYDQDVWAQFADATGPDLGASLALLGSLHARWVIFWRNLPDDAWLRTGVHAADGPVTLEQQLQNYAAHGQGHIEQIGQVLEAMKLRAA